METGTNSGKPFTALLIDDLQVQLLVASRTYTFRFESDDALFKFVANWSKMMEGEGPTDPTVFCITSGDPAPSLLLPERGRG